MNLDELRSVRDRERQTDSLQDLRASFYADAREYIQEMRVERERAVEAADDPFGSPEVRRLTDDIETAEQTLEDIYDRRVGKVVEKASFAAADMPTDDGELTAEESHLFETLVGDIRENREQVLSTRDANDGTADGTADEGSTDDSTAEDAPGDVDAGTGEGASAGAEEADAARVPDAGPEIDAADLMGDSETVGGGTDPTDPEPEPEAKLHAHAESGAGPTEADVQRATVRITENVGEILGVDQRAYHLASEDVVTLPTANADPLVERGAAERID